MMRKIEISGCEYPCRVTMGAMVRFKDETGRDVSDMKSTDLSDMCFFIWCCVRSACNADKVAFDMDFHEFADHLDVESLRGFYQDMGGDGKNAVNPAVVK